MSFPLKDMNFLILKDFFEIFLNLFWILVKKLIL